MITVNKKLPLINLGCRLQILAISKDTSDNAKATKYSARARNWCANAADTACIGK